jgi:uncharacterized YigZ family protein
MIEADEFQSLSEPAQSCIKIKGSRFLGHAAPAESPEMAQKIISEISKKFYDATHNCFAWRIGCGQEPVFRYNDAGEPSGTAGLPIFQTIEGRGLTNLVVIVTRYFGGTKLGTGGLVRAYRDATGATLDQAKIITKIIETSFSLNFTYPRTGEIMHLLENLGARITNSDYTTDVTLQISIRKSRAENLKTRLVELTNNAIKFL